MSAQGANTAGRPGRRLRRFLRPREAPRRTFLIGGVAALVGGVLAWAGRTFGPPVRLIDGRVFIPAGTLPIRPPGAVADDSAFQSACVHCGLCGEVCDNGCIRFFGIDAAEHGPLTPYLDVRRRSCTLCMKCNQVCPSGGSAATATTPARSPTTPSSSSHRRPPRC